MLICFVATGHCVLIVPLKCDLKCSHSNELKATEQYFLVLLFIMLYNLVLTLK